MKDDSFRLVCMGDSLTEGYDIPEETAWPAILNEISWLEVINSGISGDPTAGMLSRFRFMALDYDPDLVFIMGGTNDIRLGISDEVILSHMYGMTRFAKYDGIPCAIGIPPHAHFLGPSDDSGLFLEGGAFTKRMEGLQTKLKKLAIRDELPFVDLSDFPKSLYLDDGVHLNESGNKVVAERVVQLLKEIRGNHARD